jgi:hypothetical protein
MRIVRWRGGVCSARMFEEVVVSACEKEGRAAEKEHV